MGVRVTVTGPYRTRRYEIETDMGKIERSERGFGQYLKMTDTYAAEVKVVESSSAGQPCVWIFISGGAANVNKDAAAHLSVEQAEKVKAALDAFLGDRGRPQPAKNLKGLQKKYDALLTAAKNMHWMAGVVADKLPPANTRPFLNAMKTLGKLIGV